MSVASIFKRRIIPNDHECLFTSIAYLAEGTYYGNAAQRLRAKCAEVVGSDPDMYSEPVLGMPNIQYQEWIKNAFNWGGENEILILATHFSLEISVVSMHQGFILTYGEGNPNNKGRIYLLYTGQHYDSLVGLLSNKDEDDNKDDEIKIFPLGDKDSEAIALIYAEDERKIAEVKATQRIRKVLKCKGCGEHCNDTDAFQSHCMDVDHDDDFMFECEEVEIIESVEAPTPDGHIDLSSDDVFSFYNTHASIFSNFYPSPIVMNGLEYPTVEHFFQASKYLKTDPEFANKIRQVSTISEAHIMGQSPTNEIDDKWDDIKYDIALQGIRMKFQTNPELLEQLIATKGKTIVNIDSDKWAGVDAGDGVAKGKNSIGKILMQVRDEF